MNLGDLEVRIDFRIDLDDLVLASELIDEGLEISVHTVTKMAGSP